MSEYDQSEMREVYQDMIGCVAAFVTPGEVIGELDTKEAEQAVLPFYDALISDGADQRLVDTVMFKVLCDAQKVAHRQCVQEGVEGLFDYDHS